MRSVRKQPTRALLHTHGGRPPPAPRGRICLARLCRSSLQSLGARAVTPRKKFFRLPWRSARQIRADVDEELRFHLETRIDALVALGRTPNDARREALREFGDMEDARRYIRAADQDIEAAQPRSDFMSDLLTDIAYAFRKLRSAPAFTVAAMLASWLPARCAARADPLVAMRGD